MKTSIRFLAVIFAVAMMVLTLTVSANSFEDVTSKTPHYKAIDTLTSYGIIHGYEDNTYRPDLPVRRDEMAKLVYVTATTSVDAGEGVVTFPDVSKNSWAKGYISWCAAKNIVGGYEDGTFRPEGNITYDEALKMVCAILGYTDFKSELWPVDVRMKALIELNLGEGLEDVAGDAILTRAQVAQLFLNSLDEPMFVPPVPEDQLGKPTLSTDVAPSTIGQGVWGYTEMEAQIVATENWGLTTFGDLSDGCICTDSSSCADICKTKAQYNDASKSYIAKLEYFDKIVATKTGEDDIVVIRPYDSEGKLLKTNAEDMTIKLKDVNLSSYIGNSDELLTYTLKLLIDKNGEYVSTQIAGVTKEAPSVSTPAVGGDPYNTYLGNDYAKYKLNIDYVLYEGDNFHSLRRLVYSNDGTGEVVAYPAIMNGTTSFFVDTSDGSIINDTLNSYDSAAQVQNDPWTVHLKENFIWLLRMGYPGYKESIDSNGDGFVDYFVVSPKSTYEVTEKTKKTITLANVYTYYDYNAAGAYSPVSRTYDIDNYNSLVMPEKGDIVFGYFIGEQFYCEDTVQKITAFATKKSGTKFTLYGYGTYDVHANIEPGRNSIGNYMTAKIVNEINKTSTFIGFDANKGDYNYVNYYIYDGKIIWATIATDADKDGALAGQNKAILQYVDKPTEPQINEKTKQYEVFYPAYLIINGKEQLVNLKATDAINGAEASMVAQDGSMYRAYTKDGILMYRNILVEFKIDDDGYYSLTTSAGDSTVEEEGVVVEKVIAANVTNEFGEIVSNKGYKISINPSLGLMSILDKDDNVVADKIIANASSIIYYTYTKDKTGAHEYVDFYLGNEIPAEFKTEVLTGDIYLTLDKDSGLWILGTTMIGIDGFKETADKTADDYKTDARLHLIATSDYWAEYDATDEEVYANYNFKNLYEGTDTTEVNKEDKFDDVASVSTGLIYAWDAEAKDYVSVENNALASYEVEVITDTLSSLSLIFTDKNEDGLKIEEDTKLYAVKNNGSDEEAFVMEEITLSDIETVLETLETINANPDYPSSYSLVARLGYYVDEENAARVAYIIIDWVEYDEANDEITVAGTTSSLL